MRAELQVCHVHNGISLHFHISTLNEKASVLEGTRSKGQ